MAVVCNGRITLFEPRGTYQIIVEYMEPHGLGALQLAFEQLKAKLKAEGLFDPEHKLSLPYLPQKIGVITSPTGAVIRDIIQIITRRFENMHLQIIPARVQGEGAAEEIVQALKEFNECTDVEVIILARGGGSLEDLQAFNTEMVARAIYASRIPVISAIGHETDFTIADFTADLRAPTPSAAAELVVPDKYELKRRIADITDSLRRSVLQRINLHKERVDHLAKRLLDPKKKIADYRLRLDEASSRIYRGFLRQLRNKREYLALKREGLNRYNPQVTIDKFKVKLEYIKDNILLLMKNYIDKKGNQLRELISSLNALSPLSILQRGYSITRRLPDYRIVRDINEVALDQEVEVVVAKGTMICRVEEKKENGQRKNI